MTTVNRLTGFVKFTVESTQVVESGNFLTKLVSATPPVPGPFGLEPGKKISRWIFLVASPAIGLEATIDMANYDEVEEFFSKELEDGTVEERSCVKLYRKA